IDAAVAPGRAFDARDRAVQVQVRPGIRLSVICPRRANFLEALIRSVVLPAVDAAGAMLVDLDADHVRPVHVTVGIDPAVAAGGVLQEGQTTRLLVVDRLDVTGKTGIGTSRRAGAGVSVPGAAAPRKRARSSGKRQK